jgi:hypothetical protein
MVINDKAIELEKKNCLLVPKKLSSVACNTGAAIEKLIGKTLKS